MFLRKLKQRGLECLRLSVSDKCLGLIETWPEFYPEAKSNYPHRIYGRNRQVAK